MRGWQVSQFMVVHVASGCDSIGQIIGKMYYQVRVSIINNITCLLQCEYLQEYSHMVNSCFIYIYIYAAANNTYIQYMYSQHVYGIIRFPSTHTLHTGRTTIHLILALIHVFGFIKSTAASVGTV